MPKIISNQDKHCNNYFQSTVALTHNLPEICIKLLHVFYDDRLSGIQKSNRSLKELGKRFNVRPDYISRQLSFMHQQKLLDGTPHGSGFKYRWITYEAFCELEALRPSQSTSQIVATPYIDLLDQDLRSLKILEEEQICAQPEEFKIEVVLLSTLEPAKLPLHARTTIRNAINQSQINLESKLDLILRVGSGLKKNRVKHKLAYFMAAIKNEEMRCHAQH